MGETLKQINATLQGYLAHFMQHDKNMLDLKTSMDKAMTDLKYAVDKSLTDLKASIDPVRSNTASSDHKDGIKHELEFC